MSLQNTLDQLNDLDFNEIDWTRIGVWPLAGRLTVCIIAVFVVLALAYFLMIKDMYAKLDRVAAEETSLKETFVEKAFQAATLDQYKKLMEKMEKDFNFLVAQLPKDTQVPELLENIDEKGRETGLTIVSIKLQPEVVADVYVELPIEIIVKGSYHDFGSFISSVAGMDRIVTLHDFTAAPDKDQSSLLQMTIRAKTYRYLSPDEEGGGA